MCVKCYFINKRINSITWKERQWMIMMMIWTKLQHIMWCAADDDDDDDDCDGDDDDDDQNTTSSFDILFIGIYSAGIGRTCFNWLPYIFILNFSLVYFIWAWVGIKKVWSGGLLLLFLFSNLMCCYSFYFELWTLHEV